MSFIFKPMTADFEWKWVKALTNVVMCEDSEGIVCYDDDGLMVAACVADTFSKDACSVHLAIANPLAIRAGLFNQCADYLFGTRERKRLFGQVPASNKKAIKLNKHLGYTVVATIPNGICEGEDLVVMCLEKENCKYVKNIKEAA